ncbi:hypothetical protein BTJ18_05125 [Lactobacillus delbrueckii subsp. bulgaricus]|nr:hypothetical protein [Lactobacillus delbrueckii subsp. bulgaricus]MBT9039417.1 hypothetical protein [Lactobacillus delbrueckii subsp. bulgaricus]
MAKKLQKCRRNALIPWGSKEAVLQNSAFLLKFSAFSAGIFCICSAFTSGEGGQLRHPVDIIIKRKGNTNDNQ